MRQCPCSFAHLLPTHIIRKQLQQYFQQSLFAQLRFYYQFRSSGSYKHIRVLPLMVIRSLRKRHQNRSLACCRQLRNCARAAPAQNQICSFKLRRHIIQIRSYRHPFKANSSARVSRKRRISMPPTGLMHYIQLRKNVQ